MGLTAFAEPIFRGNFNRSHYNYHTEGDLQKGLVKTIKIRRENYVNCQQESNLEECIFCLQSSTLLEKLPGNAKRSDTVNQSKVTATTSPFYALKTGYYCI